MSPQVRHFVPYFACAALSLLLFFTILPLARRDDSATAKIDPQNYSLSLSTPQSTNLSINPSSSGAVGIAENSISVTANSPSGYTLYIATNKGVTDNKIYLEGATTKDNTNTINATTGTFASPAALDNNSWGYAVANVANFDTTYDTTSPSADAKFAAMPLYANVDHDTTQAIKHKTASAITPETTTVYLGTKANMTLTPGDYTTTLSYLVIGHLVDSASTNGEIDIAEGETTIPGDYSNKTIHLTTSLSTNLYLGDVAINLTKGSNTSSCTDISITTQNPLTLSCKLPSGLEVGAYDVTIETGIWSHTETSLFTIKNFFHLAYNKNTTDTVTDLPTGTDDDSDDPADTALSFDIMGKPARSGYNFLGYDESSSATTPTYAFDPDKETYTPATISIPKNTTKTLYAIWEKAVYDCRKDSSIASNYTMQNIANLKSSAFATQGTQVKLCDTRDGKAYYAAKQADGNIWMTQNLDFDLDATKTYTSADTDVTANWQPTRSTIVGTKYNSSTWTNDYNTPYSWDPGHYQILDSYSISSACTSNDYSTCANGITAATNPGEANHYHVGNLYNWSAAVATNDTAAKTTRYEIMPNSICPAGWKLPNALPKASSAGMFSTLLFKAGIITTEYTGTSSATWSTDGKTLIFQDPLYLVRGGRVYSGSVYAVGTYGYYWSSSVYSSSSAYFLFFYSSNIYPQDYYNRNRGVSVRCVAR